MRVRSDKFLCLCKVYVDFTDKVYYYDGMDKLRKRFERSYEAIPESGCWIWTLALYPNGYGRISVGKEVRTKAHRVSWELHVGPIPEGGWVLHRCDIRCCVNPYHLYIGDGQDNADDRIERGRSIHSRRFTEEQIRQIRLDARSHRITAKAFGCSKSMVIDIRRRRAYRHVK